MQKVLVIDNQTVHLQALCKLIIAKIPDAKLTIESTREVTTSDISSADLVVLSGGTGKSIERNPKTFERVVSLIAELKKPCIGICLGAEALAAAYGASLEQMPVRRVGNIPIQLSPAGKELFSLEQERVMVYEFHKWKMMFGSITELEILADSKDSVEIFKHRTLPLFGLQFHPEILRKGNAGHIIFEQILRGL